MTLPQFLILYYHSIEESIKSSCLCVIITIDAPFRSESQTAIQSVFLMGMEHEYERALVVHPWSEEGCEMCGLRVCKKHSGVTLDRAEYVRCMCELMLCA